jgi:thioredoxin-like negative regulator of GroEL
MPPLTEERTPADLSPQEIKSIYGDALKAWQAGRLTDARARFELVLAARPGLAEAQYQMGRTMAVLCAPKVTPLP